MTEETRNMYLIDSPLEEKDSFQVHSNISETLFEAINKVNVENGSFSFGLFGEWGSGKSFIINKLANKIGSSDKITFINIDVWKYSGQPLLRSILFELDKQFSQFYKKDSKKYDFFKDGYRNNNEKSLQDILYYDEVFESVSKITSKDFKTKLTEIWKRYKGAYITLSVLFVLFLLYQFIPADLTKNEYIKKIYDVLKSLAPLSSIVGIGGLLLFLFKKPLEKVVDLVFFRNTVKNFTEKANFSSEQFEGIFKDMLSKISNEKYVIIFDNIDRCEPHVAYETLSTIKTFMDIRNCFYVIPADDEAIKSYLSNTNFSENNNETFRRKFAEEFIDKIFQTYIRIPLLKEVERDKYIKEKLHLIDFEDKINDDDINTITEILYFAYKGESPRNIIRFINDYSSYFQLALKSLPELLNNITLFSITTAIKQKWAGFEKHLIINPSFFSDYLKDKSIVDNYEGNDDEGLKAFLESISTYYLPQLKNDSILSYIHFKESEKSFEIAEALKNNKPTEISLNHESVKIILSEFKNNAVSTGAFLINSFSAISTLIIENKEKSHSTELIKEFWFNFIKVPKDKIKSIIGDLFDDNKLSAIFDTIKVKSLKHHIPNIELSILSYLKEPIANDIEFEEYEKVFELFIKSEYQPTELRIKGIFKDWKKDNLYLNSLLAIISKAKKTKYLPTTPINFLVNNSIDDESIRLLNLWTGKNIPKYYGKVLVSKLIERLNARAISNYNQLNPQRVNLEQDSKILFLIYTSFIDDKNKESFIESVSRINTIILQHANNQPHFFELGIKFWVELTYFAGIDENSIDSKLLTIFNSYIKPNPALLNLLKEKIKYPYEILSLSSTKRALFTGNVEIQRSIYENLDKAKFSEFSKVMSYPVEQTNIAEFESFIAAENIEINKDAFTGYLVTEIVKELVDNVDVTKKISYLNSNYDIRPHKQIFIDNRNAIIDFYKNQPDSSIDLLSEIKGILAYSEFFLSILKPILSYLKAELNQGETISSFYKVSELLEATKNEKDIQFLIGLIKLSLEKNQEIEENYFGIRALGKLSSSLNKTQIEELKILILNNEHIDKWDLTYIDILKRINIIEDITEDEGSPAPNNV